MLLIVLRLRCFVTFRFSDLLLSGSTFNQIHLHTSGQSAEDSTTAAVKYNNNLTNLTTATESAVRNMAVMKFLAPGIIVILALFFRNKPYVYPSITAIPTSIYNLSNLDQFSFGSDAALTILSNLRSQRSAILKVSSGTQLRFLLITAMNAKHGFMLIRTVVISTTKFTTH